MKKLLFTLLAVVVAMVSYAANTDGTNETRDNFNIESPSFEVFDATVTGFSVDVPETLAFADGYPVTSTCVFTNHNEKTIVKTCIPYGLRRSWQKTFPF